jgi:transposase-like protein
MLIATKGNRELPIQEAEKKGYEDGGYAILEATEKGVKVVSEPSGGLETENAKLAAELAEANAGLEKANAELAEANAELEKAKAELAEAAAKGTGKQGK